MDKNAFNKIMGGKSKYLIALLFLSVVPFIAIAQNDFCGLSNTSFKAGEKVTYNFY